MTYLLDTNHCSRMLRGGPAVVEQLRTVSQTVLSTCAIVRGELLYMVERSQRRTEYLQPVVNLLGEMEVHPITAGSADIYGRLKALLMMRFGPRERARARRTTIQQIGFSDNDCWIAAVAQERGLIVVSGDSDFRRIAEVFPLRIETWWDSSAAV